MEAARRLPAPARYGLALLGVAVVTALIAALGRFHLANASMLYLIVVLLAAVALGRGPAVMVAFVAFLATNFFLVEPRFSLAVANPEEWVTLILLLLTAVVTGQVAAGQEQRAEEAEANAREARLLSEVAQLMTEPNLDPALGRVAERLRGEMGVLAVRIVVNGEDGGLLASASAGAGTDLEALATALAGGGSDVLSPSGGRWVRVVQPHAGRAAATSASVPALRLLRVPVRAPHGETGEVILAAQRDSRSGRRSAPAGIRIGPAVGRGRSGAAAREANEAEVLRRADELKTALLDAVSPRPADAAGLDHGLGRQPAPARRRVDEEARRELRRGDRGGGAAANRIVGNLLDLSRMEAAAQPDRGWYEPARADRRGGRAAAAADRAARAGAGPARRAAAGPSRLRRGRPGAVEPDRERRQVHAAGIGDPGQRAPCRRLAAGGRRGPAGPGMARERCRASSSRSSAAPGAQRRARPGPGGGAGLVEAHGGRIWAENRPRAARASASTLP